TYGWSQSWTNEWVSFARHSQSLLVTLMYAMYEEAAGRLSGDWHRGGFAVPLIGSLFDDEIATTVGIKKGVTGGAAPADQKRAMIAYSAIDDGTRPFGDTGIRALFNDAQDIGKALGAENASQVLKDAANPLSNIITQFAGQLAFGDVLASSTQQPVRDGVISLSDDEQTLAVDFNKDLWSIGAQGGSAPDRIIGQTELTDQIFESVGETPF